MNTAFKIGQVFASVQVRNYLENENFNLFIEKCIKRHRLKDWGDLEAEDIEANFQALDNNMRVLSSYKLSSLEEQLNLPNDKIWIITDWNRQVTTVLFPNEY